MHGIIRAFKRIIAFSLIGFGLGILMVIILPFTGWLFLFGVILIAGAVLWLCS